MANSLNMDLTDKVIIFHPDVLGAPFSLHPELYPYKVTGGFGRLEKTMGSKISGEWLHDGDTVGMMPSLYIARLATADEVADALRRRAAMGVEHANG